MINDENKVVRLAQPSARRCARCDQPIVKGESYWEPQTPDGVVYVHEVCMEGQINKSSKEDEGTP